MSFSVFVYSVIVKKIGATIVKNKYTLACLKRALVTEIILLIILNVMLIYIKFN